MANEELSLIATSFLFAAVCVTTFLTSLLTKPQITGV